MRIIIKTAVASMFLLLVASLFSFSKKMGGDIFEVYVNGKLVVQQYVAVATGVQNIQLGQSFSNDKVEVYYSHCGHMGKGRKITIKNEQNQVLKQWQFADNEAKSRMACQVKDILALQKNKNTRLNLFYSSAEIPQGRLLVTISGANEKTAKL
jgi:hypothetical protein